MSSVSGVGASPYAQSAYQANKPVQPQPSTTTPVQPVADSDGDNDGSVGNKIDVRA